MRISFKNFNICFVAILILIITSFGVFCIFPNTAAAHKGHAGPKVVFVKMKAALKKMLPTGAKLVKRKERLDSNGADWARRTFGADINEGVYTYYLASDPDNGAIIGAAMITTIPYRHEDITLVIGIDGNGNITEAAILSANKLHIPDLKKSVGVGFMPQFVGMSIKKLVAKTGKLPAETDRKLIFSTVRDTAVLLATFKNQNTAQ